MKSTLRAFQRSIENGWWWYGLKTKERKIVFLVCLFHKNSIRIEKSIQVKLNAFKYLLNRIIIIMLHKILLLNLPLSCRMQYTNCIAKCWCTSGVYVSRMCVYLVILFLACTYCIKLYKLLLKLAAQILIHLIGL